MSGNADTSTVYPWYDDRLKQICSSSDSPPWTLLPDSTPTPWDNDPPRPMYNTPREIYDFLNTRVWRQDEAKRVAAITMYQCLRGIKCNALYIGPTGCGKTHIWRCLKEIFPGKIEIVDGSDVTQDGWKGDKKWRDLLHFPAALSGEPAILVIDEADKMLAPKYSHHDENVAQAIQSEGLTILEGTRVDIKDGPATRTIDTSKISFVLCGAFSNKAHAVAEQASRRYIGFGAATATGAVQPYATGLCEQDLVDFGVMPEFLGRIQRIVNLQPMTTEDYYEMIDSSGSVVQRIGKQYGADIRLTPEKRRELAELAYTTGLGVRGMEGRIRRLVDDALFDDHTLRHFEF